MAATSSVHNSSPLIDPVTGHLSLTVDTPPDQWLRGTYKVSTIRDVFSQHLANCNRNPSVLQKESMNRLTNHISNDLAPGMEDVAIDWYADVGQITNDLDVIFFRGLMNRNSQVDYYPKPHGVNHPKSTAEFVIEGYTRWKNPGDMNLDIAFDTYDSGVFARPTRIQRRSKVLGTLLHEMLHGFYLMYSCRNPDCCLALDGDFSVLIGGDGHGPAWQSTAKAISAFLFRKFPLLEFPDVVRWQIPRANAPPLEFPDALGVWDSVESGKRKSNPQPNPQPGQPSNPQQNQPSEQHEQATDG
ncbi:hypothetical protein PG991_002997 [Apiospora marii]|uniref:SprT-like domain-containing protein n=1 Tax=Apiospora marii TaxID=335849 RepID=A0ABR1SGZ4_9PEZI